MKNNKAAATKAKNNKMSPRMAVITAARRLLDAGIAIETDANAPTFRVVDSNRNEAVAKKAFGDTVRYLVQSRQQNRLGLGNLRVTITGLLATAIALQSNSGNKLTVADVANNNEKSDELFRGFGFRDNEIYLAELAFYPWTTIPDNYGDAERAALKFQREKRAGRTVEAYRGLMYSILDRLAHKYGFEV